MIVKYVYRSHWFRDLDDEITSDVTIIIITSQTTGKLPSEMRSTVLLEFPYYLTFE